jgi:hypothetical protein
MSLNGISSATSNPSTTTANTTAKETNNKQEANGAVSKSPEQTPAAVYEPSKTDNSDKNGIYKRDTTTIDQLKAEAEKRTSQLRSLVEKLLLKQGQKVDESTDIYKLLREGKVEVDPETAAKATADIAEDGYWGVEQTSDRLVSFAKALAGGDPSKADLMIDAVKKGFEEATKAWGDTLPDICQRTLDSTLEKLTTWKNSTSSDTLETVE